MAFDDVYKASYAKLRRVSTEVRPYDGEHRDALKSWPLGDRKYSDRHFRISGRDEQERPVFGLFYGARGSVDEALARGRLVENDPVQRLCFAYIHPDNSMEFRNIGLHQGVRQIMSEALGASLTQDIKRDGVVIQGRRFTSRDTPSDICVPVFAGLRVSLDSLLPVGELLAEKRILNKERTQRFLEPYRDRLFGFCAMASSMDANGLAEAIKDLMVREKKSLFNVNTISRLADCDNTFDMGLAFVLHPYLNRLYWYIEQGGDPTPEASKWLQNSLINAAHGIIRTTKNPENVKEAFNRKLCFGTSHLFDHLTVNPVRLPTCTWGYRITYNGKPVVRLGSQMRV